ncbi:MAG: hypothetical protein J6G98_03040 [Bacilli bacterium]|nr:hypothetical protein [Bacilli bacterium]
MDEYIKTINVEKDFMRDIGNGIMLNNKEEEILKRVGINYKACSSLNDLLFQIEDYLIDYEDDELEVLSCRLAEFNYYNNTNK